MRAICLYLHMHQPWRYERYSIFDVAHDHNYWDEIDYYDKQDFSYDNFLFLPPGESEIFFDPGVREEATCEISFKEEYIAH